jgi:hypothetical protein
MKLYFTCILILLSFFLQAQTQQDSVKTTINNLFIGMKNSDTNLLKACFVDSAVLQSIVISKDNKTKIKTSTVQDFVDILKSLAPNNADEQIVFETIKIDGNLANVWTPYKFYYKSNFSHCGVNNFVLIKHQNQWLIQYLIDTRKKKDC